ncbi:ROK family protein [Kribbella solani]|uniref:ROK family protein n=1 Tax=Kribbella solani TaxID=236067 RepID=UPI00299FFE28|nr:ROK family protein [Kribbella solani]MDX2968570.1 ROK family protein [Kribbella solani]
MSSEPPEAVAADSQDADSQNAGGSAAGSAPGGSASAGHIFALIRSRPGWTRQQLLATTGVSRTTLFERLDQLFRANLVYEAGAANSDGGRPAQLLRFDDRDRVVLIFDLGQLRGRIAVADLAGRTLRMETLRLDTSQPPDQLIPQLLDQGDALLRTDGAARLVGVGMGIPSPVDPATGRLLEGTTMRHWEDYDLAGHLRDRWGVPVLIENDARALALGEAAATADDGILLAVKYSHGIGAGIVVNGNVIDGANGAAGDIGHIRVTDDGPRCSCGRSGCLAAWASGRAILRDLGLHDLDDVVHAALDGDPVVLDALTAAARRVGRTVASIVATVNPARLVLGGSLGRLDVVAGVIEAQVRADTVARALQDLRVTPTRVADESSTIGLSRQLVRGAYSAEAVDALLAGATAPVVPVKPAKPAKSAKSSGPSKPTRLAVTRAPGPSR